MVRSINRFDVRIIALDPTVGSEIQKARPCLVVSPDEMNRRYPIIIVAPVTSTPRSLPTRIPVEIDGRKGEVALEQIRAIDRRRIQQKIGKVDDIVADRVCITLASMFAR